MNELILVVSVCIALLGAVNAWFEYRKVTGNNTTKHLFYRVLIISVTVSLLTAIVPALNYFDKRLNEKVSTTQPLPEKINISKSVQSDINIGLDSESSITQSINSQKKVWNSQNIEKANSLVLLGYADYKSNNYLAAGKYFRKALTHASLPDIRELYGNCLIKLGSYKEALIELNKVKEGFEQIENVRGQGRVLSTIGMIYVLLSNPKSAILNLEKGLSLNTNYNPAEILGFNMGHLGLAYDINNQTKKASKKLEDALILFSITENKAGKIFALNNLGTFEIKQGNLEKAAFLLDKAISIAEITGDQVSLASALSNRARIYKKRYKYSKAIPLFNRAFAIQKEAGLDRDQIKTLTHLADIYTGKKELEMTQQTLINALKIAEKHIPMSQSLIYHHLADKMLVFEKPNEALNYYKDALAIDTELGQKEMIIEDHVFIAFVYQMLDKPDEAINHFKIALKISKDEGLKVKEGLQYGNLGNAHLRRGDNRKALKYYRQALNIFDAQGLKPETDGIRKSINKAKKALAEG